MQMTRSSTGHRLGARRLAAVVGPVMLGAFVLASCGADESGATRTVIDLGGSSTNFVVRPPATTNEEAVTADSVDPDERVEGTQEYEVQPNDAPFVLVNRFDITLEDLLAVNDWASVEDFAHPGTVILLPPGAKSIASVAAGTDSESSDDSEEESGPTTTTPIPDSGDNCDQGTYTIQDGDYPGKVAGNFDVTVDALNAANSGTSGYSSFYVGLEIVIPAKSDC